MIESPKHIAWRELLHFIAAIGLVLATYIAFSHLATVSAWIPRQRKPLLMLSATVVFAGSALREPYDVSRGQSLLKSWWDHAGWALGCVASLFIWDAVADHLLLL